MARRSVIIVSSDGKREGISWYDGATEAAVLRCALLAHRLPPNGAARMLWPSGEAVDFGKSITEGVTLHLDSTAYSSSHDCGGESAYGGAIPRVEGPFPPEVGSHRNVVPHDSTVVDDGRTSLTGSGGGGGGGGRNSMRHKRMSDWSKTAARAEAGAGARGGVGGEEDAPKRCVGSIAAPSGDDHHEHRRRRQQQQQQQQRLRRPSESSRSPSYAKRRALLTVRRIFGVHSSSGNGRKNGVFRRFIERTTSVFGDSDEELERRPLLGIGRVSSTSSLLSPSSSSSSLSGGGGGGKGRTEGRAEREVDWDRNAPGFQRDSLLKLKRINAHLANERTLLAWVRCVGKMFSAGSLCLILAGKSDPFRALCFLAVGLVYFGMGPYVVWIGTIRFYEAENVMKGTAHDTYLYFSGRHVRGLAFLNIMLAALTALLMVNALLSPP